MRLQPAAATGVPTSGTHAVGEVFADSAGRLYYSRKTPLFLQLKAVYCMLAANLNGESCPALKYGSIKFLKSTKVD
jgi:hypothetical protein